MDFVDTKASDKLIAIITKKNLCKNIGELSSIYQTSQLEAFHHFAPVVFENSKFSLANSSTS